MRPYDLSYLYDPETFAVNRLPAVSDHDCYRNLEEANAGTSSLHLCLNGDWQFFYTENPADCPENFWQPDFDRLSWAQIKVPGHIQLQGYGTPQYVNVQYPWDGHERLEPPAFPSQNPTGCYARSFTLPEAWAGEKVVLTFHGVESVLYCWVNGQFIGYAEDGFTPSRFDITDALHAGENLLVVQVIRFASCTWLEDQDFWRFSGIIRDVVLTALPCAHVEDVYVHTELSERYTKAEVNVEIKTALYQGDAAQLAVQLLDEQGTPVAETQPVDVSAETLKVSLPVEDPHLWSGETPYLYTLRLVLQQNGSIVEVAQTQVGLRKVEIVEGVLLLNGRRLRIRGSNRHEFCAEAGRCITKEHMLEDIRQYKRNNINTVRTSHYPNNSLWYKLCDRYGIYVIDEANMETHATWQTGGLYKAGPVPGDNPMWLPAVLDRANSMQQRDKNHPSVIIWSCGNESFGGKVIWEMSQQMRRFDPSRPIHYEGVANDQRYPDTTDLTSRMYTHAEDVPAFIKANPDKPFILCEYAHAMGNSCGALHKYLALEEQYPQYAGACVWDYVDQALWVTAPNGQKRLAYGGDFGDRPHDGEFCGNGLVFADRSITPKLLEIRWQYQPVRILPQAEGVLLENFALFANTDRYDLHWQLLRDGVAVAHGVVEQPSVEAGRSGFIPLVLPERKEAGEYVLHCGLYLREPTDWAGAEDELMHGEAVLETIPAAPVEAAPASAVVTDYNMSIADTNSHMIFGMGGTGLVSFKGHGGYELMMTPPALSLYRATTDNDRGCGNYRDEAFWMGVCTGARCEAASPCDDPENQAPEKAYRWTLPYAGGAWAETTYTALGNGRLKVDVAYHGAENLPELGNVALVFRLPLQVNQLCYYGLGPQETYPDRKMGGKLALHRTTAQESYTPYLRPQECGNHEGVRFAEITDETGYGLRVESVGQPLSVSALPWSAVELTFARHRDELAAPTYTWFEVAGFRRGVGGDDSWWSPVHPEYCLPSNQDYAFSFILSVLDR